MKKQQVFLALFLFLAAVSFYGCETSTGAGKGADATATGVSEGTTKNNMDLVGLIKAADAWVKKVLW